MTEVSGRKVEAALIIVVPEAESLVGRFRERHDPVAALGVPAHITVNYPFIPGVEPTPEVLARLSKMFADVEPFSFTLDHVGSFPNTIYLGPAPATPFVRLVERVASEFAESPPYGGQFDSIVPHLTVAHSNDSKLLASVQREFSDVAAQRLPLDGFAGGVSLLDDSTGRWVILSSFTLGSGHQAL